MDCRTFHRQLEDYLQDALDFPGRFGMERHAQQCFHCGKEVADAQRLGLAARKLPKFAAPANFEASMLERIYAERLHEKGPQARRFWIDRLIFRSPLPVLAGAAVVALIAGVLAVDRFHVFRNEDPAVQYSRSEQTEAPVDTAVPAQYGDLQSSSGIEPSGADPMTRPPAVRRIAFPPPEAAPQTSREPADSEFVEYSVPGPGDRQLILRLPRTIRMQYGQPSEEYFIRNVSH